MFEVYYYNIEKAKRSIVKVYQINYNDNDGDTYFFIRDDDEWKWVKAFLCDPVN